MLFLILFFNPVTIFAIKIPCRQIYRATEGNLCYPCSPGYHKSGNCETNFEQDRCQKCETGTYQPNCDSSTRCLNCREFCQRYEKIVQNCNDTSNLICQCIDGFYMHKDVDIPNAGYCKAHSKCKPGEGLEENGSPFEDTKCTPCKEGLTFSDLTSLEACRPCSSCNTFLIENCTSTHDVVCDDSLPASSTKSSTNDMSVGVIIGLGFGVGIVTLGIVAAGTIIWRKCRNGQGQNISNSKDIESVTDRKNESSEEKANENGYANGFPHRIVNENFNAQSCVDPVLQNDLTPQEQCLNHSNESCNENDSKETRNGNTKYQATKDSFWKHDNKTFATKVENPSATNKTDSSALYYQMTTFGTEQSENNDLSTDASPVPPRNNRDAPNRNEDQIDNRQSDKNITRRKYKGETDKGDTMNRCVHSSEVPSLGFNKSTQTQPAQQPNQITHASCEPYGIVTGDQQQQREITRVSREPYSKISAELLQPDENSFPSHDPSINISNKPQQCNENAAWMDIMFFLSKNLKWTDFLYFFRKLVAQTNGQLARSIDVVIDNVHHESDKKCDETMYQLMTKWREATPSAKMESVLRTLKECGLNMVCENLDETLRERSV